MGLTPFRKDVIVMDGKHRISAEMSVDRTYGHSRLGSELMAIAYERLVPIDQKAVSSEKKDGHKRKEQRLWAM
jgi:hypothetical protein